MISLFGLQAFLATHRIPVVSLLGVLAPTLFAQGVSLLSNPGARRWPWFMSFVIAQALLIFASINPPRYAKASLCEAILPAIHQVLGLGEKDRITIHYIRNKRKRTYEQLTNYHPTRVGRGRIFNFTHGIVGQCFTTRIPHAYSIPPNKDLPTAMKTDWSFTDNEIDRLTKDRRSYYGFPIGDDGEYAKAVLYMDSPNETPFTTDKEPGISAHIRSFLPLLERIIAD